MLQDDTEQMLHSNTKEKPKMATTMTIAMPNENPKRVFKKNKREMKDRKNNNERQLRRLDQAILQTALTTRNRMH